MFSCRYCVCNVCFGTKKILKPFRTHVLKQHLLNCLCDCVTCASGSCRPSVVDLTWIQSHLLCPKQQLLHGSDHHCFPWRCVELKCDTCFLNKPSFFCMRPVSFHRPNNCYEMGEMGTVRLHTEKYGSPPHLDNKCNWHSMMGHLSAMHQRCLNSRRCG